MVCNQFRSGACSFSGSPPTNATASQSGQNGLPKVVLVLVDLVVHAVLLLTLLTLTLSGLGAEASEAAHVGVDDVEVANEAKARLTVFCIQLFSIQG